jgi:hypothetical protein
MNALIHNSALHGSSVTSRPAATSRPESKTTHSGFRILAILSATDLMAGLANVGGEAFSGLCLAFGAILFGLSFIVKAIQKAEDAAR